MLNLQKFKEAYLEPAGKVEVSDKVSDLEPADEPWKTTGKILEFGVKLWRWSPEAFDAWKKCIVGVLA